MKSFLTLALIPLILSIGISPTIPFSDGVENNQICIDKVWIENSKGKIACVTPSTADKLVERGWGTMLSDDVFEEKPPMMKPLSVSETYCPSGVSIEAHEIYSKQENVSFHTVEEIQQARNGEIPIKHELGTTQSVYLHELFRTTYSPEFYEDVGDISNIMKDPSFSITSVDANGVDAFWMDNDSENVLLYIHGGAYVYGSPLQPQPFAVSALSESNLNILTIDYRMVPEHPFPAGLDDSKAAYRYLLEQGFSPEKIVVSGDSAGGGLILGTMLALRDEGEQLPAALALMAPWSDLSLSGDSYNSLKNEDRILSRDTLSWPAELYVGDDSYQNPYISPINGNFEDFPPVLIQVGNREVFLSEGAMVAQKMKSDGVDVNLEVWECMWHIFQANPIPEAKDALTNMAMFFDKHLDS